MFPEFASFLFLREESICQYQYAAELGRYFGKDIHEPGFARTGALVLTSVGTRSGSLNSSTGPRSRSFLFRSHHGGERRPPRNDSWFTIIPVVYFQSLDPTPSSIFPRLAPGLRELSRRSRTQRSLVGLKLEAMALNFQPCWEDHLKRDSDSSSSRSSSPPTPSDATYGSSFATIEKAFPNPLRYARLNYRLPMWDSNRSSDRMLSSKWEDDSGIFTSQDIGGLSKNPAVPPTSTTSSRAPAKNHHQHRSAKTTQMNSRNNPLRLPDRFVPFRDHSAVASDIFRTSKPVDQLTPPEKLLRRKDATPDAFESRRSKLKPVALDSRKLSRLDLGVQRGGQFSNLASSSLFNISHRPRSNKLRYYLSRYHRTIRKTGW